MKPISVKQAFEIAKPRRRAVMCMHGPCGSTDMIAVEWFTWLNIQRQPMLSFSLKRTSSLGMNLKTGEEFVLAFPPEQELPLYEAGVRTAEDGRIKELPHGVETMEISGLSTLVPFRSDAALCCELAGAYNFPFRKVRIFNCNLINALGACSGN